MGGEDVWADWKQKRQAKGVRQKRGEKYTEYQGMADEKHKSRRTDGKQL